MKQERHVRLYYRVIPEDRMTKRIIGFEVII